MQYLKGVISTSDYMTILHQNVKGVRDTLASFLEAYIYAVRKDIQEKRISIEEIVQYRLVKTEAIQQQQPTTTSTFSTPSPSLETNTTVSNEQYIKNEPTSVSSNSEQQQVSSPMITSSQSMMAKMEPGSSRSSPIFRTASPQYQLMNKSHGSVGMIEQHQQHRESPLTISRDLQQPKTSPIPATTAPNMEIPQTSFNFQEQAIIQSIDTEMHSPNETNITSNLSESSQPEPQLSQQEELADDTPLTELPHDIALQRSLIDPTTFSALMQRKVPGITIESPAFLMISEFLESKIKKLISNARLAAEHRSEQFRSNPNFIEAENPRAQLIAIEKLEKAEKKRKADLENERLSKNAGNKTKEITKEDENLNRDANEAAMSALGGKKRTWQNRKGDESGNGGPAAKKAALARAKQISMKDLLFAFEKDSFAKDSIVYRKVLYGLYSDNKN
uniref:Transcription initiation factor TFIID component TAF4 C-terminal domain-containing protein n=1 Tax=Panagrolaimus sp. PS1159 TaxID=55785 RepID=A0AC35EXM5_9BILA